MRCWRCRCGRGGHRVLEFRHHEARQLGHDAAAFRRRIQGAAVAARFCGHIGARIELTTPVLLVLGLLTRPAALVLLGMTTVIEVFVYPLAWPTHIQWAAMLLVLLCRGPGKFRSIV